MRIKYLLMVCLLLLLTSCEFPEVDAITCDVTQLIDAINDANATPATGDTIALAAGCIYELTAVDNADTLGNNGLPMIVSPIAIVGNGATIQRSTAPGTPQFRIFRVATTGELLFQNATLANGAASPASGTGILIGGAIENEGILTVSSSTFIDNHAELGGAIRNFLGEVTIVNSTFTDNVAISGGAVYNQGGDLSVSNSDFSNNLASTEGMSGRGGAIYNGHQSEGSTAAIVGSTFTNNVAFAGGAIGNGQNGHMDVDDSSFSGNEATRGGAFINETALSLRGSTVASNAAHSGGGIHNNWFLWMANNTFSGNMLVSVPSADDQGSAVFSSGGGYLSVSFTTFTANSGSGGRAALYVDDVSGVGISSSIIALNSGGDCGFSATAPALTASGNNLDSDGSCTGFTLTANPQLGPLADNGGPTLTHALLTGSPAIDGAAPYSCLPTDQRGVYRPQGSECDLGSYELEVLEPVAIVTPVLTLIPEATITVTLTSQPSRFGTILEETLCWYGPGRDGPYEVVSSLQPGTEVEVLGTGGGAAAGLSEEYVVGLNPRYNRPCWLLDEDINTDGIDLSSLPVFKAPPLPTQTPTEVPPQVGCMVPNQQKELECVYPCLDPDRWTTACTP